MPSLHLRKQSSCCSVALCTHSLPCAAWQSPSSRNALRRPTSCRLPLHVRRREGVYSECTRTITRRLLLLHSRADGRSPRFGTARSSLQNTRSGSPPRKLRSAWGNWREGPAERAFVRSRSHPLQSRWEPIDDGTPERGRGFLTETRKTRIRALLQQRMSKSLCVEYTSSGTVWLTQLKLYLIRLSAKACYL